jgi:hypothetical protein
MNRDMLSRRLVRRGYEVIMAADGKQGLDLLRARIGASLEKKSFHDQEQAYLHQIEETRCVSKMSSAKPRATLCRPFRRQWKNPLLFRGPTILRPNSAEILLDITGSMEITLRFTCWMSADTASAQPCSRLRQ